MKAFRTAAFLAAAAASFAAVPASAQRLVVLEPVQMGDHEASKPRPGDGAPAPVLTKLAGGPLLAAIQHEAKSGTIPVMLQLGETARRLAGLRPNGISWLMLSEEEGGFAKRGFWLQEAKGDKWVADPYVNMVVDAKSVADGSFEEIFAHESGHVFLHTLFPDLPDGYSRTPHGSLTLTDESTALDEGFAIHFQSIARILTKNPQLRRADLGLTWRPVASLWKDEIDRELRISGVRNNLFIYTQIALPGEDKQRARRDLSSLFDRTRLKTGEQLLASEGFVATVFYHFLADGPDDPAALAARYSPLFAALHRLQLTAPIRDGHFLPAVIQAMTEIDPEAGRRMASSFITLSYGATVEPSLSRRVARAGDAGQLGDREEFVSALKPLRRDLTELAQSVAATPSLLTKAVAPPIWLLPDPSYSVDLNIAEAEQLEGLPGIDRALARRLAESRRTEGAFTSLDNFVQRAGLSAEKRDALLRMQADLASAGPYGRL